MMVFYISAVRPTMRGERRGFLGAYVRDAVAAAATTFNFKHCAALLHMNEPHILSGFLKLCKLYIFE